MSEAIIDEVFRVLLYPKIMKRHGKDKEFIALMLKKLRGIALVTEGKLILNEISADPSDNRYLECAVEGNADFIITGDSHLKDFVSFREIKIVDPAQFLRWYDSHGK